MTTSPMNSSHASMAINVPMSTGRRSVAGWREAIRDERLWRPQERGMAIPQYENHSAIYPYAKGAKSPGII